MEIWIIWLIAAALLAIAEVLTQSIWTLCLAIGCAAGLICSLCGVPTAWQIAATAIASVAAYFILLPWFKRRMSLEEKRRGHDSRTGMDALLGRKAVVTHEIRPGELGRARIDGDNWQVRAPGVRTAIRHGEEVSVTSYDSIILTVEPLHRPS